MTGLPPNAELVAALLLELQIHRNTWRSALVAAAERYDQSPANVDPRSYWPAEINAFDRIMDGLSNFEVVVIPGPCIAVRT